MIRSRLKKKQHTFAARDIVLFLFILLLPLNHFSFPVIGAAYQLVLLPVAAFFFVELFRKQKGQLYFNATMAFWLLLTAYQGLSVLWAENYDRSVSQIISLVEVMLVSFLILNQTFSSRTKCLIENAFLLNGLAYLSFAFFFSQEQTHTARYFITFGDYGKMDPNEWCAYMVVPVIILLKTVYDDRRIWVRLLCSAYLLAVMVEAILTGSRGGVLALAAAVLFYVFVRGRRHPWALFGGTLFVGLLVFVLVRLIVPQLSSTLISRFTQEGIEANGWGGGRGEIWSKVLTFIGNSTRVLFVGNGVYGATSVPFVAHNQWLQVLLDTGLVGLALFLGLNVSALRSAIHREPPVLASFVGMQVAMMSLTAYGWFKIVYIVYVLCLIRFEDEPAPLVSEEAGRVA